MNRLDTVKQIIKEHFSEGDCGLFFSRNLVGDHMTTIYSEGGVVIDICYGYQYFEVFGLDDSECNKLKAFYNTLRGETNDT